MKILITGGCGYIGVELTKKLLKNKKNKITVLDIQWFGNKLKKNKNLKIFKFDIRNIENFSGKFDLIIHLANIANDLTAELNPDLSWDVNVLASMKICEFAIRNKINKIIFLSSGSVYGIKKEKRVTENLSLIAICLKSKMDIDLSMLIASLGASHSTQKIGHSDILTLDHIERSLNYLFK